MTVPMDPLNRPNLTLRLLVSITFAPLHNISSCRSPPALSQEILVCMPSYVAVMWATGVLWLHSDNFLKLWAVSPWWVGKTHSPYCSIRHRRSGPNSDLREFHWNCCSHLACWGETSYFLRALRTLCNWISWWLWRTSVVSVTAVLNSCQIKVPWIAAGVVLFCL